MFILFYFLQYLKKERKKKVMKEKAQAYVFMMADF